jgi:glycolate oxidase iron-sulfur subunit
MSLRTLDYAVLQQCMHCGMCLPTCPTYVETTRERNSPRGRIALMRSIADGDLEITREFADEMSYCLGCLACQTACPAGVHYAELFETARADVEAAGAADTPSRRFWRRVTLGGLFMHPQALRLAGRALRVYQRTGAEAAARRLGLTRLLPAALRRLEPQAPAMSGAFSNALIQPRELPRNGAPRYHVALLTGCVQDLAFADVNRDTADVLLANGCAVDTPPLQPCCGSLHAHNGEPGLARELAKRLIDLLPPDRYDAIISNAGGCGSHLRHYAPLLADDPVYADRARQWDARVRDIHEWLVEMGCRAPAAAPFETDRVVTYHESCHLVHGQKISRQPRQLLRLLPGVTLVELNESSWCCGAAGIYAITQPDQSAKLLDRKVANIEQTHADVVATSNPGCHLQIARGLAASGQAVELVQPVSLLARAYRRETAGRKGAGLTGATVNAPSKSA